MITINIAKHKRIVNGHLVNGKHILRDSGGNFLKICVKFDGNAANS